MSRENFRLPFLIVLRGVFVFTDVTDASGALGSVLIGGTLKSSVYLPPDLLTFPTETNVGPRSGNTYTSTASLPPCLSPLKRVSLPFTGSSTTGRARPMPVPVPIFDLLGHALGPLACRAASLQRGNLLPLYVPPGSLITILFMIGGCSAPGVSSVDAMFTFNPVGLFALFGLAVALNVTFTAAYAMPATASAATAVPKP